MKAKNFYYVGVNVCDQILLVTKIDNRTRTAFWNTEEKPKAMPASVADDLVEGLLMNGTTAFVIKSKVEFEKQFVR